MHAGALLDWGSTQSSLACFLLPEKCFSGHWRECNSRCGWHCLCVVHRGPKGAAFAVPALLSLPPGSSCNQLSWGQCPLPWRGLHPRGPTWASSKLEHQAESQRWGCWVLAASFSTSLASYAQPEPGCVSAPPPACFAAGGNFTADSLLLGYFCTFFNNRTCCLSGYWATVSMPADADWHL